MYIMYVKSQGAKVPNWIFANLYPYACLALSDVFDYTKAHETVIVFCGYILCGHCH